MTRSLRLFLKTADGAMMAYWLTATAACIGLVKLPASAMYAGYGTERVDAWNWSFAPLDLAFAVLGLTSLRLASRGDGRWRPFALISLVLTMCAGGMAVAYWALLGDVDLTWWLPNLALLLFPAVWLPALVRDLGATGTAN